MLKEWLAQPLTGLRRDGVGEIGHAIDDTPGPRGGEKPDGRFER
jgi:hypothetical protein